MRALCLFVMKPAFALIIAVLLAAPASAQTRVRSTARTTAGIVAAVAGTGLIVGAFNYRRDCDEGIGLDTRVAIRIIPASTTARHSQNANRSPKRRPSR